MSVVIAAVASYVTTGLKYGRVVEDRADRLAAADGGLRYAIERLSNSQLRRLPVEPRQRRLHDRLPGPGQRRRRDGHVHEGLERHRRHQGVGDHRHRRGRTARPMDAAEPGGRRRPEDARRTGVGLRSGTHRPQGTGARSKTATSGTTGPTATTPNLTVDSNLTFTPAYRGHDLRRAAPGTSVYTAPTAGAFAGRRRRRQHQPGSDGRRQRLHGLLTGPLHGRAVLRYQHLHEERQLLLPQRDARHHQRRRHGRLAGRHSVRRSAVRRQLPVQTTPSPPTRRAGSRRRVRPSTWAAAPRSRSATRAASRSCAGCRATTW